MSQQQQQQLTPPLLPLRRHSAAPLPLGTPLNAPPPLPPRHQIPTTPAETSMPSTAASTSHLSTASVTPSPHIQLPPVDPILQHSPSPAQPPATSPPPPLSSSQPTESKETQQAVSNPAAELASLASPGHVIAAALFVNLLSGRLSLLFALIIGGLYMVYHHGPVDTNEELDPAEVNTRPGEGPEAVEWVNHALHALFPLVSTDILTPFIDLLEDALLQQVPPIVTSVRLTSPALGFQPLLLTSMRSLTDQEWFTNLAPLKQPAKDHQRHASRTRSVGHSRSVSESSRDTSAGVVLDQTQVAEEAEKRRKRDRILRLISSRRKSSQEDLVLHSGPELDEDDPDAGQYVNYQAGFSYQGRRLRKGWGLHVLAYFGWGVKGVGHSEIPVYIDMLEIKGTLNLRLLLSPTPPFVRTATFSFPRLPDFDISATPLKQGALNAMELPGMKSYVQKSISKVAKAFVRPESFTMDLDRLLLGRDAALNTNTVGVLHIIVHSAEGLMKTDAVGTCDPYVVICQTKFRKPVFSTRTIVNTQSPVWEEQAFVPVARDAIESGERLRLAVMDSDRFSADDAMGQVEIDISDLVNQAVLHEEPKTRNDDLSAERPGMRTSGSLKWSVKFCPMWSMPRDEMEKRIKSSPRPGEPTLPTLPWWLDWIHHYMDTPDWEHERMKRRKETIEWFSGERERQEMEALTAPTAERRSGILQFHIHQCNDLEIDSLEGTYSSSMNHRLSAASGKPALADVVNRTSAETPDPPSSYCEVHLNDQLIYRTRTKQLTPLPYFNAVSERFIRDWRLARIVFVVRDERSKEHDPILGFVTLYLRDVFHNRSHLTRWYPLSGGLGWGRIRISLLFKPVEINLPPRVSAFEVATLQINSVSVPNLSNFIDREVAIMFETESDRHILVGQVGEGSSPTSLSRTSSSQSRLRGNPSVATATPRPWDLPKPIRLAVEYRHSCSVVVSFVTISKVVKKKRVVALAVINLTHIEDDTSTEISTPIFATSDVQEVLRRTAAWRKAPDSPTPSLGTFKASLLLTSGISRAHRKLCRKDLRLKRVYEVWEAQRDILIRRAKTRANASPSSGRSSTNLKVDDEDDEDDDGDDDADDDIDVDSEEIGSDVGVHEGDKIGAHERELERAAMEEEDPKGKGLLAEKLAYSKALHKRHKGAFQLKAVRTGIFVKDKLEEQIRSRKQARRRGANLEVEREGQSSL